MSIIVKPYTFSTGATIIASEHNANTDTIFNEFNGNIDNTNVKANAGIVDSKLASITTAGKVSGTALVTLGSIPSGAGTIPTANLPLIDLATGTTGSLLTSQLATTNTANGVCVLGSNGKVATANLGSGSASSSNFLRGDQSWAVASGFQDGNATAVMDVSTTITTENVWYDVTGGSVSITLSATGNIVASLSGMFKHNVGSNASINARIVYDSTQIGSTATKNTATTATYYPMYTAGKATSVGAGTYTVKVQVTNANPGSAITISGALTVFAW